MTSEASLLVFAALLCIGVAAPAADQTTVYKCGSSRSVKYSDRPCPGRVISTADAPVPRKTNARDPDVHRLEQNRALALALHRRPGETGAQFEARRRRAAMLPEDRAECARLDTRMPVEQASMNNPDSAEVANAAAALEKSRKRFGELRC